MKFFLFSLKNYIALAFEALYNCALNDIL